MVSLLQGSLCAVTGTAVSANSFRSFLYRPTLTELSQAGAGSSVTELSQRARVVVRLSRKAAGNHDARDTAGELIRGRDRPPWRSPMGTGSRLASGGMTSKRDRHGGRSLPRID